MAHPESTWHLQQLGLSSWGSEKKKGKREREFLDSKQYISTVGPSCFPWQEQMSTRSPARPSQCGPSPTPHTSTLNKVLLPLLVFW